MPSRDELRLLARVARLYYTDGLRQPEIASRLDLSQARVSRLLKRAEAEGIVRITVTAPSGVFPELEEELQQAYGLKVAFVVDAPGSGDNEDRLLQELGAAAAYYLEAVLRSGDVMGISSWSSSLLATADAMRPLPKLTGVRVVQVLGGVGNPSARLHANRLTHHFAELVNGEAVTLPSPGIAGSPESAQVLREDSYVAATLDLLKDLSLVLVGIGALRPSRLLASSGNVFSREELEELSSQGAVGALQAIQAGNQLTMRVNDDLQRLNTQVATFNGVVLERMAREQSENDAAEAIRKQLHAHDGDRYYGNPVRDPRY